MKKLEKMSLTNVKGKLSRKEMKNIFGGSGSSQCGHTICQEWQICCTDDWTNYYCQSRACGSRY
jgi:hypothetical protein